MPKPFSEPEKELIRQRLLDQAYRLFSAHGLRKTNVDEIARRAGISKGAFYIFYESKEELFMTVIEQAESRVRQELLASIDLPGPSPRARLFEVFKKAFSLFESIPILQFLTGADFDLVLRRLPAGKFQSHLASDLGFFDTLVARCQEAGIPICVPTEKIVTLLYPLVIVLLHANDLGEKTFSGSSDQLLELVAAYCLGEVNLQLQPSAPAANERNLP
jgi:AcrR family transcriptional regulator